MYRIKLLLTFSILTTLGFGQDSLFTSVSGDTLTIHHQETQRNCAALFTYEVEMLGNLITVTEVDTGDQAWCMCYFDLEVSLTGLDPGAYEIDVWSNDIGSDPLFHGALNVNLGGLALTGQEASDCLAGREDTSFVELSVSGNSLNLFWDTPMLNCALEPGWSGWLTGDTFHVAMQDTGLPADCICPFELSASFAPFQPGTYTLDFWNGEYGYPEFSITNLRQDPIVLGGYQSPCYDPTSIQEHEFTSSPHSPRMDIQCYPNPFNSQISISYTLTGWDELEILIYDLRGNYISSLRSSAPIEAGAYELSWDGVDYQGQLLSSGIYLLVFRGEHSSSVNRVILMK